MLVWEFLFISIFECVICSCTVLGFGHSPFIVISYIYRQVRAGLASKYVYMQVQHVYMQVQHVFMQVQYVYMQVKYVYMQLSSSCKVCTS